MQDASRSVSLPLAPPHVPAGMVVDFNLFDDPRFGSDLFDGLIDFVEQGRDIFYTPHNGGHWVITGHQAVFDAARDTDLFRNSPLVRDPHTTETIQLPIGLDGDAHALYRRVLVQAFSPKAMNSMAGRIREMTIDLIEQVRSEGGCDFVASIAEPLPVIIFMRLMGLPVERMAEFRELVLSGISEGDQEKREAIWQKVVDICGPLIRERQAQPQDDLISRLLEADIDGRKPTFEEMQSYCLMLFIAGLDTVVNAMALVVRHLALDQPLQAQMRTDPELIGTALEEMLRRYAANTVPRFVGRDGEFYGAPLRKGDSALLLLPAANNDPRAFPNPRDVNPERGEPHIVFNAGPHRCVGSHLARIEMKILLEEWLARVPAFRLNPARPWRYHTGFVFSIDSLHLLWEARDGAEVDAGDTAAPEAVA